MVTIVSFFRFSFVVIRLQCWSPRCCRDNSRCFYMVQYHKHQICLTLMASGNSFLCSTHVVSFIFILKCLYRTKRFVNTMMRHLEWLDFQLINWTILSMRIWMSIPCYLMFISLVSSPYSLVKILPKTMPS